MSDLKQIQTLFQRTGAGPVAPSSFAGGAIRTTETGRRSTQENSLLALQSQLMALPGLRATIQDIRQMDRADGRVKKIHNRMARDAIRGGIQLTMPTPNKKIQRLWRQFMRRLQLNNPQKLKSDGRGMIMEGNLPIQWVLDEMNAAVVAAVRMPTDSLVPIVNENGRFKDPANAFEQRDGYSGTVLAKFPLWQLTLARLDPDNFDDMGAFGRPYLDASRTVWKKLDMTETDLVIRRRERAPLRTSHVLEGASNEDLMEYKDRVEGDQKDITTNYYQNRKGSVTAIQGDANLDQIKDVQHLLDTFYAGAPAPAGLFGYIEGMARDILEDLLRDYFQEVDNLQESLSWAYKVGFELELLLNGMDPDRYEHQVGFVERRTETPNQAADRALKYLALGASRTTVFETAHIDPATERERLDKDADDLEPYPDDDDDPKPGGVKVTPGNQRKGESATTIQTRGGG